MQTVIYRPDKETGFSNPNTRHFAGKGYRVVLSSGTNYLKPEAIAHLENHPGIDRFINSGVIDIKESSEAIEPNEAGAGLVDLLDQNVEQAEDIIYAESSIPLLEQWRDRDARKGVHSAIARRIEQITEGSI